MASVLRQLKDHDLDTICHMIRRDAHSDLEIASKAEGLLGKNIASSDHAKAMVIHRYRHCAAFKKWLSRWENQFVEMEKQVKLSQQRYEMALNLVRDGMDDGFGALSKNLQARLLSLAMEATDEELMDAASGRGWVKNIIRIAQEQSRLETRKAGEKAVAAVEDSKLSPEERKQRVKEIFGLR